MEQNGEAACSVGSLRDQGPFFFRPPLGVLPLSAWLKLAHYNDGKVQPIGEWNEIEGSAYPILLKARLKGIFIIPTHMP